MLVGSMVMVMMIVIFVISLVIFMTVIAISVRMMMVMLSADVMSEGMRVVRLLLLPTDVCRATDGRHVCPAALVPMRDNLDRGMLDLLVSAVLCGQGQDSGGVCVWLQVQVDCQ